ncbi:major facilitator superfamily domain-containing protein [Clohesyomyces aquaticus]|uniref:Major facilitator superfamily domain-containing protein n=1 Tax=Clohesyomyces aquaticus TaxID=1231657 RepID=A0A1Y1ZJX2_9PLEO|nr:major facilitator superfamily domain-containing protein [Clohesyomyces aquaticus]
MSAPKISNEGSAASANHEIEEAKAEVQEEYPKGLKLAVIITAVMAALFLVALDRTIIATAVPRITDQFHSLDDISWYAGAYLITSCATQLFWGRIYTFYNTKTVCLTSIGIFEIGSVLCGAAPTSTAFIIGRAIAGIGSAGIFSGTTVIVARIVPLQKRPIYMAMNGMIFGVSSIIGPLLGGAFTDKVSWRWCFYINLPIGGVSFAIMVAFLKIKSTHVKAPFARQLIRLDPLGTLIFLPSMICILLALQWGGVTYPWNSGRIIALFVVGSLALIAFITVQIWRQEDATIPPRIAKQRSVAAGTFFSALVGGAMITMLYSIAIWFQAVKGTTAVKSGINSIPMVLSLVLGAIISGGNVRRKGRYVPWMYVSATFMSIGAGLITTWKPDTNHQKWIGYQVLFGFGIGVGMQQGSMAAQNVLKQADVAIGVSMMFFANSFGGAIFITTAQTVFDNHLSTHLSQIQGLDVGSVIHNGATELRKMVPADKLAQVLAIYNDALRKEFIVATAAAACMILGAVAMEWRKIEVAQKPKKEKKVPEDAAAGVEKPASEEV